MTVTFEPVCFTDEKLSAFLDSYFEVSALNYKDDGREEFVGYVDDSFDENLMQIKAKEEGVILPAYRVEKLLNQNWLEINADKFQPFETEAFCVYGAHEKQAPKTKKISIQIDAVTAFGSKHQTTVMCLKAFENLLKTGFKTSKILDLGTGSGILAIAAALKQKKFHPIISAIDIDPQSVCVAKKNVLTNGVEKIVRVFKGNAFKEKNVLSEAPYDLVFANIFARPLISMVRDFQKNIKAGGYAILSGFMADQTDWVLKSFEKNGFKVIKVYQNDLWRAAVVQKKEKLEDVQKTLNAHEALLVFRNNMFLCEDVLESENKILELTGFTGSAGLLVVGQKKTWLLVDGRYGIQARIEAFKGVKVVDSGLFLRDAVALFLKEEISRMICHPWAVSEQEREFLKASGLEIVWSEKVPMSALGQAQKVFRLPLKFAGTSSKEKCLQAASLMIKKKGALLLTASDLVSWLSNMRSADLKDTPVLRAYGLLNAHGQFKVYAFSEVKKLIKDAQKYELILADPAQTPVALFEALAQIKSVSFSKLSEQKLKKNQTELEGFQKAHVRDGVALVRFFKEFEKNYLGASEMDIVQKLEEKRAAGKNYFSSSFGTIAALDEHAAIVHYEPSVKTNKKMKKNALLLLDSGAQYFDGTTDITRTVGFGRVKEDIKRDFTLVLKAHIVLASLLFDEGTTGADLDKICRRVLNENGEDFKHGTGHSVGHFSDVHEAPFAISPKNTVFAKEGYVTSIEPGIYRENAYGIRIENLYYIKKIGSKLGFEPLTLFPIDLNLVKMELLTEDEKKWLRDYHQKVWNSLAPYLNKEERLWLKKSLE